MDKRIDFGQTTIEYFDKANYEGDHIRVSIFRDYHWDGDIWMNDEQLSHLYTALREYYGDK